MEPQHGAKVAPYGTWKSPVSSDIVSSSVRVDPLHSVDYESANPITHEVFHIERRPAERGRSVIVHSRSGKDVFERDSTWNSRSTVHEYGGGAATVYDGVVFFSNVGDGRLYKLMVTEEGVGGESIPITPADEDRRFRYASPTPHPIQQHFLLAILEDHTNDTPATVINSLVCIDTHTSSVLPLVSGADFYAAPSFSSDGSRLVWQEWNHPHVPWVGTNIWVADITFPTSSVTPMLATNRVCVATSVQPQPNQPGSGVSYVSWLTDDTLLFLAEASGWRNPWVYSLSSHTAHPVLKEPIQEDFGTVYKLLGASCYASLDFGGTNHPFGSALERHARRVMVFVAYRGGRSVLYVTDVANIGKAEAIEIECPFVDVTNVRSVGTTRGDTAQVVFIVSRADATNAVTFCSIKWTPAGYEVSFSSARSTPRDDLVTCISLPRSITLGPEDKPLHVVYYPPFNPGFVAPSGEKPLCIVNVHGGPTAVALQSLDWMKQLYTSRGWAWLDVNYRGSSLYGRKYTELLNGNWGVFDVLDCIHAAQVLSSLEFSLVDPARCVIRGVSAGGYTVISYAARTYLPDTSSESPPQNRGSGFSLIAGASHYGISDLEGLARSSHKFESHNVYNLLGCGPSNPEKLQEIFRRRSPVFPADNISMPLLILQGPADRVVPPEQSKGIVEAIVAKGGSEHVKYRIYEGEGHGFSRADSKASAWKEEAKWFAQWSGIEIRF